MTYFDNDCIICLDKLDKNIVILSWKHRYHYNCIQTWMRKKGDKNKICAICNEDNEIVNIEKYESNREEEYDPLENYNCCTIL